MKTIFLLTGPKNSGKSTRLMQWVNKQENIIGIICPRENGKRELYSIYSKIYKEFEVEYDDDSVVSIGKFNFLKKSFEWAESELLISITLKPTWIIIDEIGPLELRGEGFDNVTRKLLDSIELNESKLLLVIRETLVDEVILTYSLDRKKIKIVNFI